MLFIIPIMLVIFSLFLLKAYVRQTWQKKFMAAVFLLFGGIALLTRFVVAYIRDVNCFDPVILASLAV
jgi:hypothetical protein